MNPDKAQMGAPPPLLAVLEKTFGFTLAPRTQAYVLKRLEGLGQGKPPHLLFRKVLSPSRLQEFRAIYLDVLGREAFQTKRKRNVDAINAMNYALFDELHGKTVAQEGLRSVLRWRKRDSPRAQ
jgi:hypothetical protein